MKGWFPPDKLEQLQHKCKGQGKKDLYDLIGEEGFPNHNALKDRLKRKQDSWGKMAGKAAQLDIIDQALELLKTPADKAEYDRFLRAKPEAQTPPVNPQQGGYQQPERGVLSGLFSAIFFGPIKLYAKLAMFAVGLAILMQLGLMNLLNSSAPTDGEMAGPDLARTKPDRPTATCPATGGRAGTGRPTAACPATGGRAGTGRPTAVCPATGDRAGTGRPTAVCPATGDRTGASRRQRVATAQDLELGTRISAPSEAAEDPGDRNPRGDGRPTRRGVERLGPAIARRVSSRPPSRPCASGATSPRS